MATWLPEKWQSSRRNLRSLFLQTSEYNFYWCFSFGSKVKRKKKLVKKCRNWYCAHLMCRYIVSPFFDSPWKGKVHFFMDIQSIALQWSCFGFFIHSVGQFKLKHSHQYHWNLTEISTFFRQCPRVSHIENSFTENKASDNFAYNTRKRRIKK